jgi:hypothetical protein
MVKRPNQPAETAELKKQIETIVGLNRPVFAGGSNS